MTNLATVEPTTSLPDYFRPESGEPLPHGFVGSRIIRAGGVPMPMAVEGGGLIIDYMPTGSSKSCRVVLSFNELGMWAERHDAV